MEHHHNLIYVTDPEKSAIFETDLVIPINEKNENIDIHQSKQLRMEIMKTR